MEYAIAAGHERTVAAAEDVLRSGGNAVDAAIAAFLATWVVEPCMSSAGGGAFALIFSRQREEAVLLDGFCQTPRRRRPLSEVDFFPIEVNFGDTREAFHVGKGATGTPGAIDLVFEMHRRYGTMPMTELAVPAIEAAKNGVFINDFQYLNFYLLAPILELHPGAQPLFFPHGRLIEAGERMFLPGMADYLDYLCREGRDAFYRGEVAEKIIVDYQAGGGFLQKEDLESYQVIPRKPLMFHYRGRRVLTNPLPGIGGTLIAIALHLLEEERAPWPFFLAEDYILQQYRLWSEMEKAGRRPEDLRLLLNRQMAQKRGSTTHLSITDRWGNAVSLSTTNGEGCGYFVANTDIQLNNMLGEAALMPAGFHSWETDVRMSSMMAPTILLDREGRPEIVLGSGGAGRIVSAITQVVHLLIDHGLPLETAITAPRVHLGREHFNIEAGFEELPPRSAIAGDVLEWQQASLFFGGVHAVQRTGDNWAACGDPRRDGVGVVGR